MAIDASKAPDILPDSAKQVYLTAFASAKGVDADMDDATVAATAAGAGWAAVKQYYQKSETGEWTEKTFAETGIELGQVPLPGSLVESPFGAAMTWIVWRRIRSR